MAKSKARFFCQDCGQEELKWTGRCPGCGAWNTMVEELVVTGSKKKTALGGPVTKPKPIMEVDYLQGEARFTTVINELDGVLGGGLVPGSLVLVGGDPGIGKSTLMLQLANAISGQDSLVLYVSGEESVQQTRMRANRLGTLNKGLYIVPETNVDIIQQHILALRPKVVIIDSIQTMYYDQIPSAPGSVGQVRECAAMLLRLAKAEGIAILLVGHVTKEGTVAGPRVLEHMVDTVLYFEGERHNSFRILRGVKNRFGSTNEIGIFEMTENGLVEVGNPSQLFLAQRPQGVAGSTVVASLEGTRPVLLEIQALVTSTSYGMPRRMTSGIDYNRVALIMAVLEKRLGFCLGNQDTYVNVAGGVKLTEPAIDLGIALAIASSFRDIPVAGDLAVIGEIGLTGEVRAVSQVERRVKEAQNLGFGRCVIPSANNYKQHRSSEIQVISVKDVGEGLEIALGGG